MKSSASRAAYRHCILRLFLIGIIYYEQPEVILRNGWLLGFDGGEAALPSVIASDTCSERIWTTSLL